MKWSFAQLLVLVVLLALPQAATAADPLIVAGDACATGPFTPINLGSLGGNSAAQAVNDSGRVVGRFVVSGGGTGAFSWTREDGMIDLGTLGGSASEALAVNASGQIIGWSNPPR
jgi:probable HAF family extracellular repeat protein